MRVDVTPRRLVATPGAPLVVTATVSNTGNVIGGYVVRFLGADPGWVSMSAERLSLFPDTSGSVVFTLALPPAMPAGDRRMAVQVRELTPPEETVVCELDLVVPVRSGLAVRLDPAVVTGGRHGYFGLVVANDGNTTLAGRLAGSDPERKLKFRFDPPQLSVGPGERTTAELRVSGRRKLTGSPAARPFGVHTAVEEAGPAGPPTVAAAGPVAGPAAGPAVPADLAPPAAGGAEAPTLALQLPLPRNNGTGGPNGHAGPAAGGPLPAAGVAGATSSAPPPGTAVPPAGGIAAGDDAASRAVRAGEADRKPLATGTFIQRPVLSRGALGLVGLLAAVTVFAIVITVALSGLVHRSAADRDLALQIAQARNAGTAAGSASIGGTATLLTSGGPAPGVTVELYAASDVANAVATTATDRTGKYRLPGLAAGSYKVRFRGAGFAPVWYPGVASDSDATAIELQDGEASAGIDVVLGGLPGSIAGTVLGSDVSGATVALVVATPATAPPAAAGTAQPGTKPAPSAVGAVVKTVPVGSDGSFDIDQIPSPSVYDLKVSKPGYATTTQEIDLSAGEQRTGVQIPLVRGDGLISGHVTGPAGPLGGATVAVTFGASTASTVSLTRDDVGAFTVRNLPTPGTFTLVVSAAGFAAQTLSLSLSADQHLTGVAVTLARSSGVLGGVVDTVADGKPAPGVDVSVTNGELTVRTVTQSTGAVGSWSVANLPIPSTYTITFTRADLAAETVSVTLDRNGDATNGTATAIPVAMRSSTAVLYGRATQGGTGAGNVVVSLSSGSAAYTVRTASVGTAGSYEIDDVRPGTYTLSFAGLGTTPTSEIVTLVAGQRLAINPTLVAAAAITGTVQVAGAGVPGYQVVLYVAADYPGQSSQQATTSASGTFAFHHLDAPQNYIVQLQGPDGSILAATSPPVFLNSSAQLAVAFASPDGTNWTVQVSSR